MELPRKRGITGDHPRHVIEGEEVRMLLRRIVPGNEMQVTVHSGVLKFMSVTNNGVEIAFRGGDEISIVHEDRSG